MLSILVSNHFGVLMRVCSLISRKGVNIKSLSVDETDNPVLSRIMMVLDGDKAIAENIRRLLIKQEDVRAAFLLPASDLAGRELVVMRVRAREGEREAILALAEANNARMLRDEGSEIVFEQTGNMREVNHFTTAMRKYDMIELYCTGATALSPKNGELYTL